LPREGNYTIGKDRPAPFLPHCKYDNMRWIILTCLLFIMACTGLRPLQNSEANSYWHFRILPENPQENVGDAAAGFQYLITGNYLGTGIPVDMFADQIGEYTDTVLYREGLNAYVDYSANVFQAANGVDVVNGNCFTCHAHSFKDEVILGLGNIEGEYQDNFRYRAWLMNVIVKRKYKKGSPEREAFGHFGDYYKAIAPNIRTNNPVVNPAFRLEEACVVYRNPEDLTYTNDPQFKTIPYTLAVDVPPLWHVQKKSGLYYNGMGRGDYSKLLMQASVLGIPDSTAARRAQESFEDVLSWVMHLEPPSYPYLIVPEVAAQGEEIFNRECAKCHGTYGDDPTYPNKIVSTNFVGTDPLYARYFTRLSGLPQWYNDSWFAKSFPRSSLEPIEGYIAPPLDGIWATAPYLHNGSIPTIEGVLNSADRPDYWEPFYDIIDSDRLGLLVRTHPKRKARKEYIYDTSLPGYSNQGHYFGDPLSAEERAAVIEYLKTL
jgi:mono/diheme cytochrome c family protein